MAQYDNPLVLTTPHLRGPRVQDAQWLLAGNNEFHDSKSPISPYKGRIDGEYGPASYAATKAAKYWLGYAASAVDGRFGQTVYELLLGKLQLGPENTVRRLDRIKAAATSPKLKALKFAEGEIGNKESPYGSNMQKYGAWYGLNGQPWCAIFVSYCLFHTSYKTPAGRDWKYSYVPMIHDDARYGRNGMSTTQHPEPGDLVCYTFHGIPDAHVAFFHDWADSSNHYFFHDLGGNTGPVNMSNGGEVLLQPRNMSQVTGFVRLA